jgi:hypothetical protein
MHDLLGMAGEGLADGDDGATVERARDRQVVVDDLRHAHPDRRQEDAFGRLAQPGVLGRRLADDDRGVDRVAPHRHRRDVEDRERLGRRVVAGVIAEGTFDALVADLDVALEHHLRVRRAPPDHGLRADELDGVAAEEPREHELVDVLRQRARSPSTPVTGSSPSATATSTGRPPRGNPSAPSLCVLASA